MAKPRCLECPVEHMCTYVGNDVACKRLLSDFAKALEAVKPTAKIQSTAELERVRSTLAQIAAELESKSERCAVSGARWAPGHISSLARQLRTL